MTKGSGVVGSSAPGRSATPGGVEKKKTAAQPLNLEKGLVGVSWQKVGANTPLPTGRVDPQFLPQRPLLDQILHRPTMEERLFLALGLISVDPELLRVIVFRQTRLEIRQFLLKQKEKEKTNQRRRALFAKAAEILDQHEEFDEDVTAKMAALVRA